jgi:hypothetical protein
MGTRPEAARFVALTPVRGDRRRDFEEFLREVVIPAVTQTRPEMAQQWQALSPEADDPDGTAVYAFLFYGDAPFEDWDLGALLLEAYGEEAGRQRMEQFESFLDGEQQVHAFVGAVVA